MYAVDAVKSGITRSVPEPAAQSERESHPWPNQYQNIKINQYSNTYLVGAEHGASTRTFIHVDNRFQTMGHVKGIVVFPIATEDVGITFDILGVFPALE